MQVVGSHRRRGGTVPRGRNSGAGVALQVAPNCSGGGGPLHPASHSPWKWAVLGARGKPQAQAVPREGLPGSCGCLRPDGPQHPPQHLPQPQGQAHQASHLPRLADSLPRQRLGAEAVVGHRALWTCSPGEEGWLQAQRGPWVADRPPGECHIHVDGGTTPHPLIPKPNHYY